jgi:hypothetical protein
VSAGDRQLVREAVASYFGGSLVTADSGIAYQGGPLVSAGLGTAYPYQVKGIPDEYYTAGMAAGAGWGTVMGIRMTRDTTREAMGGPTSGWRKRVYTVTCELVVISYEQHVEIAGAGLDDLLDGMYALIFADRTLGTTSPAYSAQGGRLIMQAGEGPYGIKDDTQGWWPADSQGRGKYIGQATLSFQALTMVAA